MSVEKALIKLLKFVKASYKGFKIGDLVKNTNSKCMHYGSMGRVVRIENLPNNSGYLIHYKAENSGLNYKPGDVLAKTEDQLELA